MRLLLRLSGITFNDKIGPRVHQGRLGNFSGPSKCSFNNGDGLPSDHNFVGGFQNCDCLLNMNKEIVEGRLCSCELTKDNTEECTDGEQDVRGIVPPVIGSIANKWNRYWCVLPSLKVVFGTKSFVYDINSLLGCLDALASTFAQQDCLLLPRGICLIDRHGVQYHPKVQIAYFVVSLALDIMPAPLRTHAVGVPRTAYHSRW